MSQGFKFGRGLAYRPSWYCGDFFITCRGNAP